MNWRRTLGRIALVIGGIAIALYFLGVVFFTDCPSTCVKAGEQAPGFGFVAGGVFLATLGITLSPKRSTLRSVGAALFVAAFVALAGTFWVFAAGGRGSYVWVMLAIAGVDALVGGWLAFWRPR